MCGTCGCGEGHVQIDGKHHQGQPREIALERDIMAKNDSYAQANRDRFGAAGILALNLVSSPGAGKTALLVKTLKMLQDTPCAVIEGDQQTTNDADRIRATGVPAVQINTGKGCHLDAHMVGHAVDDLAPQHRSLLFIENVGHLVCPAGFDLGEAHKVVVLSATEGEDKPLKYPVIFLKADAVILNKIDLAAAVEFDRDVALNNIADAAPRARVFETSARKDDGLESWYAYLRKLVAAKKNAHA